MRTSGASTDGPLTFVPIVAGIIIVVLLLGGPTESLKAIDRLIRAALASLAAIIG